MDLSELNTSETYDADLCVKSDDIMFYNRLAHCIEATMHEVAQMRNTTDDPPSWLSDYDMSSPLTPRLNHLAASCRLQHSGPLQVGLWSVDLLFPMADAIIETVEGKRVCNFQIIGVNRAFCAQYSTVLRRAFFGNTLEARERRVALPAHTHAQLVAFLALCTRHATAANTQQHDKWLMRDLEQTLDLLDLARFLNSPVAVDLLGNRLLDHAHPLTYVLILHRFGDHHPQIYALLWKRIINNCHRLVSNRTYRLLYPYEFSLLLNQHPNISQVQEIEMLRGYCKIRDPNDLSIEELRTYRRFQPLHLRCPRHRSGTQCPANHHSPNAATRSILLRTGCPDLLSRGRLVPHSVLAVIGGWATTGPSQRAEVFNGYDEKWIEPADSVLQLPTPRSYHEIVPFSAEKKLLVLGGFDGNNYYEGSCMYDLDKMEWTDESNAFMNEKRCYVSACLIDPVHVLAIGGYNNRVRLSSSEILNSTVNLWSPGPRLTAIRSDSHCTKLHDRVYVVGGFDGQNCHNSAEILDPNVSRWIPISRRMRDRRSGVCAIGTHNAIFVVGGFTGRTRLTSVEFYDPREGLWHSVAAMNSPRSNFGIAELRDEIYVAGGYDGQGTTTRCERLDLRNNQWTELPEMKVRRSALSMVCLTGDCVRQEFITPRAQQTFRVG